MSNREQLNGRRESKRMRRINIKVAVGAVVLVVLLVVWLSMALASGDTDVAVITPAAPF